MKTAKRFAALFLSLLLALGGWPLPAQAAATDEGYITEGDFHFTSNNGRLNQGEDHFVFREDCFMRSSFLGCRHLALLSSQAAQSSAGYIGGSDGYETDFSQGSRNIEAMLKAMGFEHVESNAYYHQDSRENSCAVALGLRRMETGGKTYTLMAVFPRSMRYQQEWAGNFTVGGGHLHQGLKEARDEVLRFMKQYVDKYEVQGDVKIWTAGHSRGGAVANMLGGFLAGGGAAYLGDELSLRPEDLYCYTFAAPRAVKAGADRQEEMTVSAARQKTGYGADTPGEAYSAAAGGLLNPGADIYGGIRNYILEEDVFAQLPPADWGFVHYGTDYVINDLGADFEDMKARLSLVSNYLVDDFALNGGFEDFSWTGLDLAYFQMVPYSGSYARGDLSSFLKQRVKGLIAQAPTNEAYAAGDLQETLVHGAGLISILSGLKAEDILSLNADILIQPLLLSVLAYTSERLTGEGRAATDREAVAILLAELLHYFSGSRINPDSCTVDDALGALARLLADHEDSPLYENALRALMDMIPSSLTGVVRRLLGIFHRDSGLFSPVSLEEAFRAFIRACAYGADPESSAAKLYPAAADARSVLFSSLSLLMGDELKALEAAIGEDGQGRLWEVVDCFLPVLLTGTDLQGNVAGYGSLWEAADKELAKSLEILLPPLTERCGLLFGEGVKAEMIRHWQGLKPHTETFLRTITYVLFYTEGEAFSAEQALVTACTLARNGGLVPLAHYNEVYSAWLKAAEEAKEARVEDHAICHVEGKAADKKSEGLREHWILQENTGERCFADRNLSRELSWEELVIPRETEAPTTTATRPPESSQGGESRETGSRQATAVSETAAGIPPETAPGEQSDEEKGAMVLWIALGLLAVGGGLSGLLFLAKKKGSL